MALLYGREDLVPIAFDVGTVSMQLSLEPRRCENSFTNCNFLGNGNSDSDWNHAEIRNDFHDPIVTARFRSDGRRTVSTRSRSRSSDRFRVLDARVESK